MARNHNYSSESSTMENMNDGEKYAVTGESEFSRDLTIPFDENEVLIERHFVINDEIHSWRYGRDHTGRGPKGYKRSDERIYEDVCEALWRSPEVDPSGIEVSVEHGIVRLAGTVPKRDIKRWAERLIEHISGVMDVRNEIVVGPSIGLVQHNRTGMI